MAKKKDTWLGPGPSTYDLVFADSPRPNEVIWFGSHDPMFDFGLLNIWARLSDEDRQSLRRAGVTDERVFMSRVLCAYDEELQRQGNRNWTVWIGLNEQRTDVQVLGSAMKQARPPETSLAGFVGLHTERRRRDYLKSLGRDPDQAGRTIVHQASAEGAHEQG
jgi:hypothetical protein